MIKGKPASGKSTFLAHILPESIRDLCFTEGLDLSMDRDYQVRELRGMGLVDCSELAGVNKASMATLKYLTTAPQLPLTPKYLEMKNIYK